MELGEKSNPGGGNHDARALRQAPVSRVHQTDGSVELLDWSEHGKGRCGFGERAGARSGGVLRALARGLAAVGRPWKV